MNIIGSKGITIGETKIWTNSDAVCNDVKHEIQRRRIVCNIKGENPCVGNGWKDVMSEAMKTQIDQREGEYGEETPGIMIIQSEAVPMEVYYMDTHGGYWDEITNRR